MDRGSLVLALLASWTALLSMPVAAATRVDLNRDWQFRADPEERGETAGWTSAIPAGTESIIVPHTWNIGRLHDYRGVAWYFRSFAKPATAPDGHVELHFGATFYKARMWLNGVALGSHEGGFTAYSFDITSRLRALNTLVVRVDNRADIATIPGIAARGGPDAVYDWWPYGGLVRDVWLTTSGPAWIRRQSVRTEQVAAGARAENSRPSGNPSGTTVPAAGAPVAVHDRIFVGANLESKTPVTVHVTAFGPDNQVAAQGVRSVTLARGPADVEVLLELAHPQLWGLDHPNIYRMLVQLRGPHDVLLDENDTTFGVRTLEIRDRHLLLNGERVRLTGMARHEDSPWEGLAETRGTIWHDYDDMKALHTTLSRPVHYPQSPLVLDYADRHGILLIPEIPVWQFSEAQLADPKVIELARQQMREMIEEAGNHPSVFAWSVANESAMGTPGGITYFRALRAMIRDLDPQRPVSFADDGLYKLERPEQSAASEADFIMMNQYFGSWHGPEAGLGPALDKLDRLYPDKMVIVSEMGYAGIFAGNSAQADRARITIIREQLPILAARDWIGGAMLWCYQDYKSQRNLWPGEVEGYVDHGLVDEYRQRRPSYAVWKELNSPARLTVRWEGTAGRPPEGFSIEVAPNTERDLPFYPLHDYQLVWSVVDERGRSLASGTRSLAELTRMVSVTGALATDSSHERYRMSVQLLSPTGLREAEGTLVWSRDGASRPQ
jgi:beta-glucuronidase